ncbi:MAG: nuclear transport factor 2 family protein [Sporichthyaceae bacterium]
MHSHPRAAELAALVVGRDWTKLGAEFSDDVRLRATLPGGQIEKHGRADLEASFQEWFGDYRSVALEEALGDDVGDRLLVHYRLGFESNAGEHTVLTQTWVGTVATDGRLARIDVLCSGFRRVE